MRREKRVLAEVLAESQADVVLATHPAYAFLLEGILRDGGLSRAPLFFNVVTDSISINSLWWSGGSVCAGWFVPNEDSASVLRRTGIGKSRLFVCGFPVRSGLGRRLDVLQTPGRWNVPRVLFIVNSEAWLAVELCGLLFATRWRVTVAAGRNAELMAQIEKLAEEREGIEVLGWAENLPDLLISHHVVVSKAGGATVQEALAAACPMVVCQWIPGQEEGNVELLSWHGAGCLAESAEEVMRTLRGVFENGGEQWLRWRAGAERLSRPFAARDIVEVALAQAGCGLNRGEPRKETAACREEKREVAGAFI